MPRQMLNEEATWEVLTSQNLLRVAFNDEPAPYVIPLGYVCVNRNLYGVADTGRKTELAGRNGRVSFQVDTALDTGLWEWRSVLGTGDFVLVEDDLEKQAALGALQRVIAEAPQWWRAEQGPKMAAGAMILWKIAPTDVSGCEYVPPEE